LRCCRFAPSVVRRAIEEIVTGTLKGKVWRGEEETVWTVAISEQIKAKVKGESRNELRGFWA